MGRNTKKNSIANIAAEIGVSTFAVSCVVNNRPGVSDATRRKIQKILQEVGYSRNYKLSTGRTIGLVLPGGWDDWYISALVRGVLAYSSENNSKIATIIHHFGSNRSLLEELRDHNCDAAVVTMSGHMIKEIENIADKTSIPIILMDTNTRNITVPSETVGYINNDSYQGSRDIAKYLIDLNHRRIAFISRKLDWEDENQTARLNGWKDAMTELGFSHDELKGLLFTADSQEVGKLSFVEKGITAVMCIDDYFAMSCLRSCYERNIRVPDQLSVTGFGNMDISAEFSPPLTTVDQKTADIGYHAAKYAYELATGKRSKLPKIKVPTELVIRKSTASA